MEKKWKRTTFIVATNVVASQPPERWPTVTPHACAKSQLLLQPTEVELGLQVGVEFDNSKPNKTKFGK